MENGYVILGIIALLFLSMYGYSYLSVVREKMVQKREQKAQLDKEELRRQRRLKNQEIIDEKVRLFNKRKEEIQHELMMLERMRETQKVS
ncbi:hypothetical protein SAMN05428642_102972 [Flaviramulus basaltis]|uniref:Uncharacterized protein n=1 Tax=Flaviramulus basaltis TaxID=369401 RepID=A0A1K2IM76_9FLAO|nr:hypothetical protein [Flaviramulus basaltis]SFZ92771.1 hypothetical protein SAMN05428642_102972 [Flaviramulus basaltis]